MDMPATAEGPLKGGRNPELLVTPELQNVLDMWKTTGDCPFPELRTDDPQYWANFSTIDLQLVHHIAALTRDLHKRGYASCTIWAPQMPA